MSSNLKKVIKKEFIPEENKVIKEEVLSDDEYNCHANLEVGIHCEHECCSVVKEENTTSGVSDSSCSDGECRHDLECCCGLEDNSSRFSHYKFCNQLNGKCFSEGDCKLPHSNITVVRQGSSSSNEPEISHCQCKPLFYCIDQNDNEVCHNVNIDHVKQFICSQCNYTAASKYLILKHLFLKHSDDSPIECHHCSFITKSKDLLKKHMKNKHNTENKYIKCKECNFFCIKGSNMKRHVMTKHRGFKPYKCTHCDYSAAQKGTIKRHIRSRHTGEKPYHCPHCSYRATQGGVVSRHIRAKHFGLKPYQCNHCDYSSSRKHLLAVHIISKHVENNTFILSNTESFICNTSA